MVAGDLQSQRKNRLDSLWWRDLKEVWALDFWKDNFEANILWEVGNGREIRLWDDSWAGNVAIKELFPRLHSICTTKESLLWQVREWSESLGWVWKIEWRRTLFEWELSLESQLMHILGDQTGRADKEDRWVWNDRRTKRFTVKSAYNILRDEYQGEQGDIYMGVWRLKAQPSAHLLAWRVLEDKIATKANLARRGVGLINNICSLCGEEEETTSHLFCTCRVAWLVWEMCSEWAGTTFVSHRDPKDHFLSFRMSGVTESVNQVWGVCG